MDERKERYEIIKMLYDKMPEGTDATNIVNQAKVLLYFLKTGETPDKSPKRSSLRGGDKEFFNEFKK